MQPLGWQMHEAAGQISGLVGQINHAIPLIRRVISQIRERISLASSITQLIK